MDVTIDGITSDDQYKIVQITLQGVSRYKGICCNSTETDIENTGLKEDYYGETNSDLIFTEEDNGGWTFVDFWTLRYKIPSEDTPASVTLPVGVRSLDFGGNAVVHGSIYRVKRLLELGFDFEDKGKKYKLDATGTPIRGSQIPRDENYNLIADSWKNDYYNTDGMIFRNFDRDGDLDESVNSIHEGDRIIALEEYRGFMIWQRAPIAGGRMPIVSHIRTSPDTKEIFIVNEDSKTKYQGIGIAHQRISAYLVPSTHVKDRWTS